MGQKTRTVVEGSDTKSRLRKGWLRALCGIGPFRVFAILHLMFLGNTLSVLHSSVALAQGYGSKSVFDTVIVRNRAPGGASAPAKSASRTAEDGAAVAGGSRVDETDWAPITNQNSDGLAASGGDGDGRKSSRPSQPGERDATHGKVEVRDAQVSTNGGKTHFHMELSSGVRVEIFTLANPYRVIMDLPDVVFHLPDGVGQKGAGLVSAFRYGLFADNKGRVVIDVTGPVRIEGAKMLSSGRNRVVNLEMEFSSITAAEFGAGTGAQSSAAAAPDLPVARPAIYDDAKRSPGEAKKPLVLIDPGHGGIDPGAVGVNHLLEKTVVLAVAKRVERRLQATGRYRVAMTRERDVFLSLDQRVKVSSDLGADLFISLHADSLESKTYATQVRGATVYTLSERASDEQARLMAEKENASDLAAGIDSRAFSAENEEVRSILFDLMKRETSNFSTDFSNLLLIRLKQSISISRDPQRSAAFRVLKQTRAPSVLIELGYLSNEADAKLMRQAAWQGKVARSIVAAIDAFFDKRIVRTGRSRE